VTPGTSLVDFLCDPANHPERPSSVRLVQTHISWVFVGDDVVYKVKKPVNFGFLDFGTLELRKFYTYEELRLNRRFSPEVYLDVVPVSERGGTYRLGDVSNVVEYALRMRRISDDHMLSRLLEKDLADDSTLRRVGAHLGGIYRAIPSDDKAARYGSVDTVRFNVTENFEQTAKYVGGPVSRAQFERIQEWSMDFLARRSGLFEDRCAAGWVKECHGDLHLQHVCVDGEKIWVFDCIEFNERFRYGDVASDVAFLAMDLDHNGREDLAHAFVEGYRGISGDPSVHDVLTFYKVYRAYVRAKVTSFMLDDVGLDPSLRDAAFDTASRYYRLAHRYVCGED